MQSNVHTEASLQTRISVWLSSIPFVTRCTLAVCVGVWAVTSLTGVPYGALCLAPQPLVHGQLWRVLTAALMHGGLLHLVLNMTALVQLGSSLERRLGSLPLLWAMLLVLVLGDALYVAIAYLWALLPLPAGLRLPAFLDFMRQCAVGISGVLFGLILIENSQAGERRSVFGLFSVPARLYPWALLLLWQLLVPQASFLGHLTGLLVGELYVLGALRWALPSSAAYTRAERACPCYHAAGFVAHAAGAGGDSLLPTSHPHAGVGYEALSPRSPRLFPYVPFPDSSHRLAGLFSSPAPAAAGQQAAAGAPHQQPAAQRLDGGAQPEDAGAAAAAAAEARAGSSGSKAAGK